MKRIGEKITAWKGPNDQKSPSNHKATNLGFNPRLLSRNGIPETADAIAYEPVGTSDGTLKVFGKYGVECLMKSTHTDGTKILFFPPNSGCLLRVTLRGVLELFDLETENVVGQIEINDDAVECLSPIPGQPYIVLGCTSGLLRVCCLADGNMDPINHARSVINLRLLNYRVSKHSLGAGGKMTGLSVCLSTSGPLALMVHSTTGAAIWNIRFSRPVCSIPNQSLDVLVSARITDPGEVRCAAWIGKLISPVMFATGHESGDVLTWSMPHELSGVQDQKHLFIPRLVHRLVVRPENALGSKVQSVSFISGQENGILVFGGQALEEPAGLNLFHLESTEQQISELQAQSGRRTSLAWFGNILDFVLVPPEGSIETFDDPSAIIILAEFGNLVLHDLQSGQPIPFSMPFQMCHKMCSASLYIELEASSYLIEYLMTTGDRSKQAMEEIGGVFENGFHWILRGGATRSNTGASSKKHPFLILGYEDGCVRFWSIGSGVPICLNVLEKSDICPMASITAIEIIDEGEFLIVGDSKGHVFIFEISKMSTISKLRRFRNVKTRTADIEEVSHKEGYQPRVVFEFNAAAIWKITFHPESHYLAALDGAGGTCIVNLITLEPLYVPYSETRSPNAIVDVGFCETAVSRKEDETVTEVYLFMTDAASGVVAMDPTSGEIVRDSDWLHPKNESKSVQLLVIDINGGVPSFANFRLDGAHTLFWATSGRDPEADREGQKTDARESMSREEESANKNAENGERKSSEEEESAAVENDEVHHERFQSDDTETNAMLAAAVAKMDETEVHPHVKPSKRRLPNWRRRGSDNHILRMGSGAEMIASLSAGYSLLLITDTYIRHYAPHAVLASVRAPLRKVTSPGQIVWATPFSYAPRENEIPEGGIIVLSYDGSITVFATPSLDVIGTAQIDEIVDFPLFKKSSESGGSLSNLTLFEGNGHGGIYICGPNGEIVFIDCIGERKETGDAESRPALYDWDLAYAAHSASHLTQNNTIHADITIATEEPSSSSTTTTTTIQKGFEFFASLGRRARDELDKAIRQPGKAETPARSPTEKYEPPRLDVLFCVNDHKAPPETRPGLERNISLPTPIQLRSGMHRQVEITDVVRPMSPTQRTAEEIRAKYGRPRESYRTDTVPGELGSVMSENKAKLHERGDRLRTLNDKTEEMVNDAQSFAEMARKLAQQKSKKWWQL